MEKVTRKTQTKRKTPLIKTLFVTLLATVALVAGGVSVAWAAAGDVPDHSKVLTVNDDGTYTIALNVTGDSEKKIQKVNVIVIVDRSGSMNTQSGTGAYVPSNQNGTNMYGLVDGEYVALTRHSSGWGPGTTYTYTVTATGADYTGQRYQYDGTATRLEATKAAVDALADTLLGYNGKDGNPEDVVEMALVSFATGSATNVSSTTSASTYLSAVNDLTVATGQQAGTNWESALMFADVPHMRMTTQRLHAGNFVIGKLGGKQVIVLQGRLHLYEGYSSRIVVFPVFILHMLGVKTLILTNASGGINLTYSVGDIVAVSDHINFMGVNPLRGDIEMGRKALFPDMTDTYTPKLRGLAREQAKACGIDLHEGVYIGVAGPSLETPAEIRAFRVLGADLVGMSTVLEAIAARDCKMEILALSLVTNMAAGVLDEPISGEEIVATAKRRATDLGNLIEGIVANV